MGVTFGTYHSKTYFNLTYIHREIEAPGVKVVSVDIPLVHGKLDLTDRLTGGYPVFENRKLTLGFEMINIRNNWLTNWANVANTLHGKVMEVKLDEDPNWYWVGRVSVGPLEDHGFTAGVTITVDAFPYKWNTSTTSVGTYSSVGTRSVSFTMSGYAIAQPIFTVSNNLQVTYNDEIFIATSAVKSPHGLYIKQSSSSQSVSLVGSGNCTFAYRGGSL